MQHQPPEPPPETLLTAPISPKNPSPFPNGRGTVSFSTRDLARTLGLSQPAVRMAFDRIKDADVVVFEEEPRERVKPIFRVLTREEVEQREQNNSYPVL